MILGIGLDMCDVRRIARACESERFIRRVFTEEERTHAEAKSSRNAHLAGAFAAKEAFAKAVGLGLARVGLLNVSVGHTDCGAPILRLNENAPQLQPFLRSRFHLSITHDGDYACAIVICESECECAEK